MEELKDCACEINGIEPEEKNADSGDREATKHVGWESFIGDI